MSVNPYLANYETWCVQKCPFCGRGMPVVARGYVFVAGEGHPSPDRGYSFCNCKNVWYTDWSNIDQFSYFVPEYTDSHQRDFYEQEVHRLFNHHIKRIVQESNGGKMVLDLGCVVSYLLDCAKSKGFETTGLDIIEHPKLGHKQIVGNFDNIIIDDKFDIIYSNHFFEHIQYPLEGLKKCYDMLNPGGLLFVSMPDPFQIPWYNPGLWGNFILRQHHIMWDMDSFCDEAEKLGFTTIFKKRNFDVRLLRDMHLLFKKDKWKPIG
jgi:2-polyprenyl-3-methyl-5-hydroxy-6-metoxy-1,4-benzoquinol methylase